MSCFDRQGIAENLVRAHYTINSDHLRSEEILFKNSDRDTDSTADFDRDHDFEDDVATLRDFSFIIVREESTTFAMHRLVQLTVRAWLKADRQMERWMEKFIAIMCQSFPTCKYENWHSAGRCFHM